MLLAPQKKSQKRLREVLNHLYGHLDNSAASPAGADVSICAFCMLVVIIIWSELMRCVLKQNCLSTLCESYFG